MAEKRSFLLLQGVCSPFFMRLAARLMHDGHRIVKVNFNVGDAAYWQQHLGTTYAYRDRLETLGEFLDTLYKRHEITDQLLFGDQRPVHRPAVARGNMAGIRTHVLEEGYLRPFWITMEREGVNGHSLLPRQAGWYREVGKALPAAREPVRFHSPFLHRALHDIGYHLAGLGNPLLYPHYRNHAPITAPLEYAAYLRRFTQLRYWKHRDAARIHRLLNASAPYYMLPLQLVGDAQIRHHSPFTDMTQVIEQVMHSFSRYAPGNTRLCIKNHPLDTGLEGYARTIARLAREYDIMNRVVYLESGDLNLLFRNTAGVITVNSTSGFVALEHGCPTLTLSDPIYHLPGLTFQGQLDAFWHDANQPDAELFTCFRRVLLHTVQINGGFYCRKGIELAVNNTAQVLEPEQSPLEALL